MENSHHSNSFCDPVMITKTLSEVNNRVDNIEVHQKQILETQNKQTEILMGLKDSLTASMNSIAMNTGVMTASLGAINVTMSAIEKTNTKLIDSLSSKMTVPIAVVLFILVVFSALFLSQTLLVGGTAKIGLNGIEMHTFSPAGHSDKEVSTLLKKPEL